MVADRPGGADSLSALIAREQGWLPRPGTAHDGPAARPGTGSGCHATPEGGETAMAEAVAEVGGREWRASRRAVAGEAGPPLPHQGSLPCVNAGTSCPTPS